MSTRDDARLTARERAALANLEAAAVADDPQLSARLRGTKGARIRAILPRVAAFLTGRWRVLLANAWLGVPIAVVGLVLVVLSPATNLYVGIAGALITAAGLRLLAGMVQQRFARTPAEPDEPES